jgi:hypothetical protein
MDYIYLDHISKQNNISGVYIGSATR